MDTAAFYAACREVVARVWPECLVDATVTPPLKKTIYLGIQLARIPFQRLAEEGRLPVAVIDADPQRTDEWGRANRVKESMTAFYYVGRDSLLPETDLLPKLEALRTELRDGSLDYGQVIGDPDVSVTLELTPNQYFIRTAQPVIAGVVRARIIAGETRP